MKVLVTGGAGFLGSHVCEAFAEKCEVIAYDNLSKFELERSGFDAGRVRDSMLTTLEELGVRFVLGDIRDRQALIDACAGVDLIAHTAAQPAMTISLEDVDLDFSTNVTGTLNVLEAARRHGATVAICSTIHVYGPAINDSLREGETRYWREPAAIGEDTPILATGRDGKLTPLHASKAAAEHYARVYADSYGVKAAIFRFTGIYGPRQYGGEDHGWVANFALRNAAETPINLFGSGKQLRDILYASDAAAAFVAFAKNPVPGVYNIGGGEPCAISLLECIELIDRISGRSSKVEYHPPREGDLAYFVCDTRRAEKALGWQPTTLPEVGLRQLLAWIGRERTSLLGVEV